MMSEPTVISESVNRAAQQQQFAEWLLMTPAGRVEADLPRTQKEMAQLLGRSQATLSLWKKDERLQRMISRHVRASLGERLGYVIDALYEVAVGNGAGTASAQVAAAKTLLGWYEKDGVPISAEELSDATDEELAMLARRAEAEQVS